MESQCIINRKWNIQMALMQPWEECVDTGAWLRGGWCADRLWTLACVTIWTSNEAACKSSVAGRQTLMENGTIKQLLHITLSFDESDGLPGCLRAVSEEGLILTHTAVATFTAECFLSRLAAEINLYTVYLNMELDETRWAAVEGTAAFHWLWPLTAPPPPALSATPTQQQEPGWERVFIRTGSCFLSEIK